MSETNNPNPKPAELAKVAHALRTVLNFHQQLGLEYYPATPALRSFLTKNNVPIPKRQAPPPRIAGNTIKPSPSTTNSFSGQQLLSLRNDIKTCSQCSLATRRQGIIPGLGNKSVRLMIIGDWSRQSKIFEQNLLFGHAEDEMLWKMMAAIGLGRDDVFVTNCVKCCPPPQESVDNDCLRKCFPFLEREIALIRPSIVCAMGEVASKLLLNSTEPIFRLRGVFQPLKTRSGGSVMAIATFHPEFLLVHSEMKKVTWTDLQAIQKRLPR